VVTQRFYLLLMNDSSLPILLKQAREISKVEVQLETFNKQLQKNIERFDNLDLYTMFPEVAELAMCHDLTIPDPES